MDPARTVDATIRYEVRIVSHPYSFKLKGREFRSIGPLHDIACLARIVLRGRTIVDEKIVGVVGDESDTGSAEFLRLRAFLNGGGVIGLHQELVD